MNETERRDMTEAEFCEEVYRRGVGIAVRMEDGVRVLWPMVVNAETGDSSMPYQVAIAQ